MTPSGLDPVFEKEYKLIRLAEKAERIVKLADLDADPDWEIVYDLIFTKIAPEVRELGFSLEYYDPDTSYEEDARAYVQALVAKADKFKLYLDETESQE